MLGMNDIRWIRRSLMNILLFLSLRYICSSGLGRTTRTRRVCVGAASHYEVQIS